MALLTPKAIKIPGVASTLDLVSASDTVAPVGKSFYEVNNASAGAVVVTIAVPGSKYGQANPDVAHTVPAGERWKIDLPRDLADPDTGLITITHDVQASITGAVFYH